MRAKFSVLEQTQGLQLQAKFHLNVFIVSASGGHKPQFWANFDILGAPVPSPFTDEGQIWCAIADPRFTFTCEISSKSLISVYSVVLWLRKTPIFVPFFGLRHLVMSPIGINLRKVHNYKPFPIQRHQNRFCTLTPSWRNRAHNL